MALLGRGRKWLGAATAAALLATLFAAAPARAESGVVTLVLDQAQVLKLPERVATLVIGNPLIADAALQAGGIMVITGKGYGATNVMALDRNGGVLLEKTVEVRAPRDSVVVYRGVERQTYSCAPQCQPRITLGDSEANFNLSLGQVVTRNTQLQGAAR